MDRNLGAVSATPKDDGTIGLQYQWGRNTPFPGYTAFGILMENQQVLDNKTKVQLTFPDVNDVLADDGNPPVSGYQNKNALDYAIRNPRAFIVAGSTDWYSYGFMTGATIIDSWIDRWEEKIEGTDVCGNTHSTISLTNPCPEGWKVPAFINPSKELDKDLDSPWGKENTESIQIIKYIPDWHSSMFDVNRGLIFTDDAYKLGYYPAAAMRTSSGSLSGTIREAGLYWSASFNGHAFADRLFFDLNTWEVSNHATYYSRANGMSVRCVKE